MGNLRYSRTEKRWKNYGPNSDWYKGDEEKTKKWIFINSPEGQKWKEGKKAKGEWENFSESSGNGK